MANLTRINFKTFLAKSEDELLETLMEVVSDLFHLEQELSLSLATEAEAKVLTFFEESNSQSLTLREWAAKRQALTATMSSLELKGEIAALRLEKEAVEMILNRKFPNVS